MVSGTASIDDAGHSLHHGDPSRQLGRTLDNIEALLGTAGAEGNGLCMLIAYLRDLSDEHVVRCGVRERFGQAAPTLVQAPVR